MMKKYHLSSVNVYLSILFSVVSNVLDRQPAASCSAFVSRNQSENKAADIKFS